MFQCLKSLYVRTTGQLTIVVLLHFLTPSRSFSQDLKFHHFTTAQGLSQSWVTCIAQDSLGFLWIGTEIGLNRFDGERFVVHKTNPNDTTRLMDNSIWSMLLDSKGRFWIGTATGLEQYDFVTNRFIHHEVVSAPGEQTSKDVRSIVEDRSGDIWIATSHGIGKLDTKSLSVSISFIPPGDQLHVTSLMVDRNGTFWVTTKNGGLFTLDHVSKSLQPFDLQYSKTPHPEDREMQLSQSFEDRRGNLWIATDAGLLCFDKNRRLIRNYSRVGNDPRTLSDVHHIAEDAEGNLWIAHSNGASILSSDRSTFTHHNFSPDKPDGLNNHYVTFIFMDRSENIWLGTRNAGLNVTYSTGNNFKLYRHQPNDFTSLSNNVVKAVLRDRDGVVWLGTDGGGLNKLKSDGTFRIHRHNPDNPQSLPNDFVLSVYEDKRGDIWVGTFGGALSRMKGRTGTFEHFFADTDVESKLKYASVSVMYEDSHKNFWVGTWYGGLHLLDRDRRTFKRFPYKVIGDSGLSDEKVLDILEVKDNKLMIGTGRGLNIYDLNTGKFKQHFYSEGQANSLSGNVCNSICQDKKGRIWIGTENGLNLFDPVNETFTKFGTNEGLPSETIQGLLFDISGSLWISTLNGITRFNPDEGSIRNYTVQDNLQGSEFITHSYFRSDDGVIVFGGNNGANLIDPARIKPNTFVPPVVFTGLKVMNKEISPGEHPSLKRELNYTDELTLPHDQAFFTLEFTALNFANATLNKYAYRLDDIDRYWNNIGSGHSVTYNGLAPGEYIFRVKASNNDGVWNEQGASLKIIITPPVWQTTWFRFLAFSILAIIVFTLFYLRIRLVRRQNEALEKLVDMRTKELKMAYLEIQKNNNELVSMEKAKENMLAVMSHEIRTPLNSMIGLTHVLKRRDPRPDQIEIIDTLKTSGDHLLHLVNDVLDYNKIQAGKLDLEQVHFNVIEVLKQLQAMFRRAAEEKNLQFTVQMSTSLPTFLVGDPTRLLQILSNLLSNAIKFTNHGAVNLYARTVKQSDQSCVIEFKVEDTGIGIPADKLHLLYQPFSQLHPETHRQYGGTGLGLLIVKNLVQAMKGNVVFESHPSRSTTVTVTIPFSTEADTQHHDQTTILPKPDILRGLRILYTEDVESNQFLVKTLLSDQGMNCMIANDGHETLSKIKEHEFDLILLDIQLPDIDGYELTARIRDIEGSKNDRTPIVLFSAHTGINEEKIKCCGANDFIGKPFQPDDLLRKIERNVKHH